MTVDDARDNFRHLLADKHPNVFAWGHFVTKDILLDYTLRTQMPTIQAHLICEQSHSRPLHTIHSCLMIATHLNGRSLQSWMNDSKETTHHGCPICHSPQRKHSSLLFPSPLIALNSQLKIQRSIPT